MNMRRHRKRETIRQEAQRVLASCGVKRPPVPVEKIAEFLGAIVKHSPFEGELAGMLVRGEGQVLIGVNSLHHPNRKRFTIAHECGHLLLHEGESYIDKSFRVNMRDDVSSKAINRDEIEANKFAAELLMPYEMVLADLRSNEFDLESEEAVGKLAKKYGVSVQAMTHRVTNLLDEIMSAYKP